MKSAIPSDLLKLKKRFEAWRKTRAIGTIALRITQHTTVFCKPSSTCYPEIFWR
jgi:hypothetical protein